MRLKQLLEKEPNRTTAAEAFAGVLIENCPPAKQQMAFDQLKGRVFKSKASRARARQTFKVK